ncbi:MAG TPA: sodium:proton antiporter [Rhodobacteraceae bacterium]|nr:sodium:proton antiporter [Paracoccaceae bacterium]
MTKHMITFLLLLGIGAIFADLLTGFSADQNLNASAEFYATHTVSDTGAANIVTAIIVTFRGLDTLGEVTVLFLTAAIVALVLSGDMAGGFQVKPKRWPVGELLETGTRLLVPLIALFGAYVFINGHLTPGGGFQGGAILASAMLLMLLADPTRRFAHKTIARIESVSGLFYVLIGVLGLALAGGFLDNRILPLGDFGSILSAGAIPLIYVLIGLKVGAEFSSIMTSLSESEDV